MACLQQQTAEQPVCPRFRDKGVPRFREMPSYCLRGGFRLSLQREIGDWVCCGAACTALISCAKPVRSSRASGAPGVFSRAGTLLPRSLYRAPCNQQQASCWQQPLLLMLLLLPLMYCGSAVYCGWQTGQFSQPGGSHKPVAAASTRWTRSKTSG